MISRERACSGRGSLCGVGDSLMDGRIVARALASLASRASLGVRLSSLTVCICRCVSVSRSLLVLVRLSSLARALSLSLRLSLAHLSGRKPCFLSPSRIHLAKTVNTTPIPLDPRCVLRGRTQPIDALRLCDSFRACPLLVLGHDIDVVLAPCRWVLVLSPTFR